MDNLPYVPASELNQATNVDDDDPMTGSVQAPTNALATNGGGLGYSSEGRSDSSDDEYPEAWIDKMAGAIGQEIRTAMQPADKDTGGGISIKTFNGTIDEDVDEWFLKFEFASTSKRWNDQARVEKLPCFLDSHAFTAYISASEVTRKNYKLLKEYLCDRFRPSNPFGFWRNQFRSRKQALKEAVVSYAHGLQAIVTKLGLYDPANAVTDVELKEVFMQGLHPYYKQRMVGALGINNFEDAVKMARGLEEGYRSVHPETSYRMNHIGEPIIDAHAILSVNPKDEAELLGMSADQVEKLVQEVRRKVMKKGSAEASQQSINAAVQDKSETDTDKRLSRMESMLKKLGDSRENRGNRYDRYKPYGRPRYGRPSDVAAAVEESSKRPRSDDIKCYNCNKMGHIARNCRDPPKRSHFERTKTEGPLNSRRA